MKQQTCVSAVFTVCYVFSWRVHNRRGILYCWSKQLRDSRGYTVQIPT